MRKAVTDKTVSALEARSKRYEVHDVHLSAFGIHVTTGGRKTFFNRYRLPYSYPSASRASHIFHR